VAGVFDFCPNTHVAEEIPPEEPSAVSMNGWDFVAKPSVPYRRKFKLTLGGMRWYLNAAGDALDLTTDPQHNAGRLLKMYQDNRKWDTFTYDHEYLGTITCRFDAPVSIPKAIQNSNGLVPDFDIQLVHHNPGWGA
jgi:hypothetical protein